MYYYGPMKKKWVFFANVEKSSKRSRLPPPLAFFEDIALANVSDLLIYMTGGRATGGLP